MTNPDPKPLLSLEEFLADVKAPDLVPAEEEVLDPVPVKPVAGLLRKAQDELMRGCVCPACRRLLKAMAKIKS